MNKFEYAVPQNVAEVFEYLKDPHTIVKAGGIDLLDLMKEGIAQPGRLVNIRYLSELNFIKKDKNGLRIGPNVTLAMLADNANINRDYRALAQAADGAATPQIRNAATLGGNLCQRPRCWYFRSEDFHCARKGGDICFAVAGENQYHAIFGNDDGCVIVHPSSAAVALLALDARLKLVSEKSQREVTLEEFYVAPAQDITRENILNKDEMIAEIILPPPEASSSFYFKQKEKQAFDWPVADVAVSLKMAGSKCEAARVVLGSAAPVPWRATAAEASLKNQTLSIETAKLAAEAALKDATPLSMNAYKLPVFRAVIQRTICWAAGIDPFA